MHYQRIVVNFLSIIAKPWLTEGNVLYFPHIEIRDDGWLKAALCIWDSVYRIVPQGYTPQDSDDVREAADAGAIRNLYLSPKDLEETREEYHDFLAAIPYLPDALERPPRDSEMIHREKLDERMVAELTDVLGVITRHGDWLELPRGLADGYMLFLSNTISRGDLFQRSPIVRACLCRCSISRCMGTWMSSLSPKAEQI